jgi:hypothetical protein
LECIGVTLGAWGLAEHAAPAQARAVRLLAAGRTFHKHIDTYDPEMQRTTDRSLAALRTALGEAVFAVAWAAGQALPLEEAVAEAFDDEPTW